MSDDGTPTHAGGVVFRQRDRVEYLLVEASDEPDVWVLPKGHVEPGETLEQTAVREVREEAGVWARWIGDLHMLRLHVKGREQRIQFYLMEQVSGGPLEPERRAEWRALPDAVSRATHPQTRRLLEDAERLRAARTGQPPR